MAIETLADQTFGDTIARYRHDVDSGAVELMLLPASLAGGQPERRAVLSDGPEYRHLPGWTVPAWGLTTLAQAKWIAGGGPPGYGEGRTMLSAAGAFKFVGQQLRDQDDRKIVFSHFVSEQGCRLLHRLMFHPDRPYCASSVALTNETNKPLVVEMLASFCLGGITPFASDDAPGRLRVHRLRCEWAAEGRLESQPIEAMGLERSWLGHGVRTERFGVRGTMPNNGLHPFVAVEDTEAGVIWGAQLAWAGSWQMELFRKDDTLAIAGGLGDRDFGHWVKQLEPGETFETPAATLACVRGDIDALCHRLTAAQTPAAERAPAVERDLPIVVNEWCTSWGEPTHDSLVGMANRLRGTPVKYLVIDAGWYAPEGGNWGNGQGDWQPSAKLYPDGLAATAAAIRERGLVPGLWFELEVVGPNAAAWSTTDHLLHRDGMPFESSGRRFWDFNDPFVVEYLTERVIGLLRDCGFGYIKVDYNATLGAGVDHDDSFGEGLRQQVLAVQRFFERMRSELPDLVIENCSSGGERLEPSMMAVASMGSFSDAHEPREIPIVAANVQRMILPRQSQVWAVLRSDDDDDRLVYSLAATFLGRMCLSGDLTTLDSKRWRRVEQAMAFYRQAAPLIRDGRSRRVGPEVTTYRHPTGWQAVVRSDDVPASETAREALIVAHRFGGDDQPTITLNLGAGAWRLLASLSSEDATPQVDGSRIRLPLPRAFTGCALHLRREG